MSYIVAIEMKKKSKFLEEAKVILQSFKYAEISESTFIGATSSSAVIDKLKALDIYNKEKTTFGIKIYHGNITTV